MKNLLLKTTFFISLMFSFSCIAKINTNLFYISLSPEVISKTDVLIKKYGEAEKISFMTHDAKSSSFNQKFQLENDFKYGNSSIVVTYDTQAAQMALDLSKKNNQPLVYSVIRPTISFLSYDKAWYVGPNETFAGQLQAKMLKEYINKFGNIDKNENEVLDVIVLRGEKSSPDSIARSTAFVSQLMQYGYIVNPLSDSYANWDYDLAKNLILNQIKKKKIKNIEAIVANNDKMALGAISALQEHGYNKDNPQKYVPVFGIGGDTDAITAIQKGQMSGTVIPDFETIAKVCVDIMTTKNISEKELLNNYNVQIENRNVLVNYSVKKNY